MACGGCASRQRRAVFVHKDGSGKETSYASEVEARAAVARRGGTYSKK